MKIITYYLCNKVPVDATSEEEEIVYEEVLTEKQIHCNSEKQFENGIVIAQKEAHNGDYTVEDDGQPYPQPKVSTEEVLNALLGVE